MHLKRYYFMMGLLLPLTVLSFQDARNSRYQVRTVAFYNLENLFDTVNDSLTHDDDRTADGRDHWTLEKYRDKIAKLARVLALIGSKVRKDSPDLIGLCELENLSVLQDLVTHEHLLPNDYGVIHFDSPDERGIDVALLYRKSCFVPFSIKSQRLILRDIDGYRDYTRDLLIVGGMLEDMEIAILVNHWPSRSGGELQSRPYRIAAAQLNRHVIDSLKKEHPNIGLLLMGDFNDNPADISLRKVLGTKGERKALEASALYNPMEKLYSKGVGSLGYRDQWHLFDQILVSLELVAPNRGTYKFWKAGVFNPPFLTTQEGPYKGYPFRTYASGRYQGGYSDHFPVYAYLIRKVE